MFYLVMTSGQEQVARLCLDTMVACFFNGDNPHYTSTTESTFLAHAAKHGRTTFVQFIQY